MSASRHYAQPGWITNRLVNPAVAGLTRLGVSVWGSRVLEVPGRNSGEPRRTPVNVLEVGDARYLVSPRGHTQWVRNLRASRRGRLLVGRRAQHFVATELGDDEKPLLLRRYLARWGFEVSAFFDGVNANSSDTDLRRIAPDHPVFRIDPI